MMLARFVPAVKRIFAGTELMKKRVGQRAAGVFIEEEVFATRDRTGILLFVSLTEHKVVVLGDSGINAKVQHADWQAIVDTIVDGIVQDRFVDGLVNAVGKCGALLERMGVNIRPDDRDELTDNLRVGRP
jgi:putative membrane protein